MSYPTTCIDCGKPRYPKSPRCQACRNTRAFEIGRIRARRWYKANAEKARERMRQLYSENKHKNIDLRRSKQRKSSSLWRKSNQDKVRETAKRYREANREERRNNYRKWYSDNMDKVVENNRKHRARKRSAFVANVTSADIARLMEQQCGLCPYCQQSIRDGYHVDHYIPLAKGGTHEPANVQLLCPACNMSKGSKLPEVFAKEHGRLF